ncbi:MAG: hypothetical protein Q9208_004248 [Pyrenodesmia sp. 3 TL-2023]
MFDFAIETAKNLDRHQAETGTVKGPLHGLPVGLKDQFHVQGYDTTMGCVGWIWTFEGDQDSAKVHRTSLSQTLMLGETVNNIIGTTLINLLDYSAAVVPVTRAGKFVDKSDDGYKPLNETDRKNWESYDPETYDGAPVGLQIVARRWEEEKVWAIAKIVDTALRNNDEAKSR